MLRSGVAVALLMLAACGGSSSSPADGGVESDAPDPNLDTDQDGVPDVSDVCPGVADPSQFDLDGDHIGWACDPEESQAFALPDLGNSELRVHGFSVAAELSYFCTGQSCKVTLLGIGNPGLRRVDSDSTAAADSWAAPPVQVPPIVTKDDEIYWSSRAEPPHIGLHDLSVGTFVPKVAGAIQSPIESRGEVIAFTSGDSTTGSSSLLVPRPNGVLQTLGVLSVGVSPLSVGIIVNEETPPLVSIPLWNGTSASLVKWTPGAASWSPIQAGGVPLAGISELTNMFGPGTEISPPYCARRAGVSYWVDASSQGDFAAVVPFSTCYGVNLTTSGGIQFAFSGNTIVFRYQGTIKPISVSAGEVLTVEAVPGDVPTIIVRYQSGLSDVWSVNTNGAAVAVLSQVETPVASSAGTVVHAFGGRSTGYVIARMRGASAPVETGLTFVGSTSKLLTTAEGAALVGDRQLQAVPSQTMTPEFLDLGYSQWTVRGAYTVIAGSRPSMPALPDAIYAYDEVGGVPRLTTVVPPQYGLGLFPLDAPRSPASQWFYFGSTNNQSCTIAYMTTVGGAPAITGNLSCGQIGSVGAYGYTSRGELVALDGYRQGIHLLGTTMGRTVVSSASYVRVENEAFGILGNRTIAFTGVDGPDGFICLASNPERCWRFPGGYGVVSGHWGVNGEPDSLTAAALSGTPGNFTLTVVKSIGTGTRPPPL